MGLLVLGFWFGKMVGKKARYLFRWAIVEVVLER